MRQGVREWASLLGRSLLVAIGGVLAVAALVDLGVAGASARAFGVLAAGLLLAAPPLAFAFRDALREARQGRI